MNPLPRLRDAIRTLAARRPPENQYMQQSDDHPHGASWFAVPGGRIYHGGPLSNPIFVADPAVWARPAADTADPRPDTILAAIQQLAQDIKAMSGTLQTELDQLTTQVANATTVEASAVALIGGFSARLDAAVAAAQSAGATQAQLQPFADLGTALDTGSTSLAQAVAANTPAA